MAYTQIKTDEEQKAAIDSGKILSTVLSKVKESLSSGITTRDIESIANKELKSLGGKPAFLGYQGFPSSVCISLNDEVVHGMPSDRALRRGDLVSVDFGVIYDGMITDSAFTAEIETNEYDHLLNTTERSLYEGIDCIKDGVKVGTISSNIQKVLEAGGLGIVRDLVGHGVGKELHEEPNIPNFGIDGKGPSLDAGMTVAIEPMATLGSWQIRIDPDGWTVRTADGSMSAHFEHTVLVTKDGYQILTQL